MRSIGSTRPPRSAPALLPVVAVAALLAGSAACQEGRVAHAPAGLQTVMVSADGRGDGRPLAVEDVITVRVPSQVGISPDGRWVSFVVTTPDLEDNSHTHDLFVVPADGSAAPRQVTRGEPRSEYLASRPRMSPIWAPDSDGLAYVARGDGGTEIRRVDLLTGREEALVTSSALGGDYDFSPRFAGSSLAFSPDGGSLAFLASKVPAAPAREKPLHAIEADEDFDPSAGPPAAVHVLFVLARDEARARALTDESLDVASFDWSPDGRRLAFEASTEPNLRGGYMKGDLFVVDAAGGSVRSVVRLDGWDRMPAWSPDGRTIAFGSQRGAEDWMYTSSLTLASVEGGSSLSFIGDQLDAVGGGGYSLIRWTPDGESVDVAMVHRLGKHLFRVRVADGTAQRLTPRDDRWYDDFAYSKDASLIAFTVQSAVVPPDVYVSSAFRFEPRRLTELNPDWDSIRLPRVEMVKWRSRDDRWDVHGLLLTPPGYRRDRAYPMLTAILGGPSMVRQQLNLIWNYPLLALADRGYVVFLPNSRGRAGFGMRFTHAIRDEQSYVTNPLDDVLSGVEELVGAGIAHPDSLGVLGFSYGGTLTSNAITTTDRFQAAIYGEGSPFLMDVMIRYPTGFFLGLFRDMWGIPSPFDPEVIQRSFDQSALFRLDRVRTPVLIEAGEISFREMDRALYRGLQAFGIPAEFYVYPRSGHGWDEPLLKQDAYRRHVAWFDYWIRDIPHPNADKRARYDAWKERRRLSIRSPRRLDADRRR